MDNYKKNHLNLNIAIPKALLESIDKRAKSEYRKRNNWIIKTLMDALNN